MRKVARLIAVLLLICLTFFAASEIRRNSLGQIVRKIARIDRGSGWDRVTLDFQVNYLNVVRLGEVSFALGGFLPQEEELLYLIALEARDGIPFSWIKPFKLEIFSYLDTTENLPVRFVSRIEMEGRTKEDKEIIYNQEEGYMLSKGERYKILPQTRDPLSLMVYLMGEDFSLDEVLDLNVNSNQANYRVSAQVKSKDRYTVQGKDYFVWQLDMSVRRRSGGMRHSMDAKAYFLETPYMKIPLLIKASTNMGPVLLRLEKIH